MTTNYPRPLSASLRIAAALVLAAAGGAIGTAAAAQSQQQGTVTIHVGDDRLSMIGQDNVLRVTQSEPASRWVVRQGDVVLSAQGRPTRVPEDYFAALRQAPAQGSITVEVRRGGATQKLNVPRANYGNSLPPAPPAPPPTPR